MDVQRLLVLIDARLEQALASSGGRLSGSFFPRARCRAPLMLRSFAFENFLSFRELQTGTIDPATGRALPVGENGSGKTNVIRAISFTLQNWNRDISKVRSADLCWNASSPMLMRLTFELAKADGDLLRTFIAFCLRTSADDTLEKLQKISADVMKSDMVTVGLVGATGPERGFLCLEKRFLVTPGGKFLKLMEPPNWDADTRSLLTALQHGEITTLPEFDSPPGYQLTLSGDLVRKVVGGTHLEFDSFWARIRQPEKSRRGVAFQPHQENALPTRISVV